MNSPLDFVLLDVFSDRIFGGNQLAVFPSAGSLETDTMAAIARELKTNETTFVTAREADGFAFRIFSPYGELPFAGHPTIGTAAVLAEEAGLFPEADGRLGFILRAPAGLVHIEVSGHGEKRQIMLQSPTLPQRIDQRVERSDLAAMLGLEETQLAEDGEEAQAFSAGIPFFCIPLKDRSTLTKARLDKGLWDGLMGSAGAPHLYLFAPGDDEGTIHARMFAPAVGIDEDPATGGAAIALGGFLAARQSEEECQIKFDVHQGSQMGRPSHIRLEVDVTGGKPSAVRIGGQCVPVARCTL